MDNTTNTISPAHPVMRQFNKHLLNPLMLRLAGRRHWYASVIEHTGRRTSTIHRTPVVALHVADGFVIPLPYGTHTDWLQNAMASRRAVIISHGERHDVKDPHVVESAETATELPARRLRSFRRLGVEHFVHFAVAPTAQEMTGHGQ